MIRYDLNQVRRIAERATTLWADAGEPREQRYFVMDITLCTTRLDLDRLEAFPDSDFAHDIGGIARHIDHATGVLGDCFTPRCAARD